MRTFGGTQNIDDISANRIPLAVALFSDLFFKRYDCLCPPQIDQDVASTNLLNSTRNNFTDSALVVFVNFVAFGFTHPLHQYLLGGLDGITPKSLKRQGFSDFAANFNGWVDFLCFAKRHLQTRVFHPIVGHNIFDGFD